MRNLLAKLSLPAGLALAFAAQIGLFSSLAGKGVPVAVFPVAVGVVVMLGAPVTGFSDLRSLRDLGMRDLVLAALSGALGLFAAPFLVAINRYSDAPPGSELIFFAGVLWGAMAVLYAASMLWRRDRWRGSVAALSGALAAVTGAAGVLASWERPSSFSPLVRYAAEEMWMLVAGAAFLAGGLLIARLGRKHGAARPMLVSGAAGTACGFVAYLVTGAAAQGSYVAENGSTIALWAAAAGITWLLWAEAMRLRRPVAAGASLMLAPSLISLLIFAERVVGVSGPNPLVWTGVAGGTALVVAGTATLARADRADDAPAHPAPWVLWAASALAAVAAAGLLLPAISAAVTSNRGGAALDVTWALLGWETVAGWVALSCAALFVAAASDGSRWSAAASLLAPVAYIPLVATPYHVLTSWLSSEVQVDFGTEYAAITFKALTAWPARVAVVGAAVGLVVVLTGRTMRPASEPAVSLPTTEE